MKYNKVILIQGSKTSKLVYLCRTKISAGLEMRERGIPDWTRTSDTTVHGLHLHLKLWGRLIKSYFCHSVNVLSSLRESGRAEARDRHSISQCLTTCTGYKTMLFYRPSSFVYLSHKSLVSLVPVVLSPSLQ